MEPDYVDLFGVVTTPPALQGAKSKASPLEKLAKLMDEASTLEAKIETLEAGLASLRGHLQESVSETIARCVSIHRERIAFFETCVPQEPRKRDIRELLVETILDFADDLEERFGEDVEDIRLRWEDAPPEGMDDLAASVAFDLYEDAFGLKIPPELREIMKLAIREGKSPQEIPEVSEWMAQNDVFGEGPLGKPSPKRKKGAKAKANAPKFDPEAAAKGIYRRLARELHPDKTQDDDDRERRTELMQQLTRAWTERDLPTLVRLLHVHGSEGVKADGLDDATVEACLKEMRRTIKNLEWRLTSLEYAGHDLGGGPIPTSKWLAVPSLLESLVKARQSQAQEELQEAERLRELFPDRESVLATMHEILAEQARERSRAQTAARKKPGKAQKKKR